MSVEGGINGLAIRIANQFRALSSPAVTTAPLYEYRELWAEEAGALGNNTAEWSYGNGATGYMGIPIDAGWEVIELAFNADTYAATATVTIELMSYLTASNSSANTVASLSLTSATDGGGGTNNAWKHEVLSTPISVPAGPVGFLTRSVSGTISDARVYARMRRKIGDYVTGLLLT